MAVIIQTSFEDYADGVVPEWEQSLIDHGWGTGGDDPGVITANAHTGVKSVAIRGGTIWWPSGYLGRHVSSEMWALTSAPTSGFGAQLSINSSLGSAGITTHGLESHVEGTTDDLVLFIGGVEVARTANVVTGTYQKFRLEVRFSTVNSEGTDVNADGGVCCYVEDVRRISLNGIRVWVTSHLWSSGTNHWDRIGFATYEDNFFDDVYASDDVVTCTDTETLPPNDSAPCCGTQPETPLGPNPGDPTIPLQPWERACAGGGMVPTAADVVDVESWAL